MLKETWEKCVRPDGAFNGVPVGLGRVGAEPAGPGSALTECRQRNLHAR